MNFLDDNPDDEETYCEQAFGEGFSKMVDAILRRKVRTPDYPNLCKQETHKIFVYGTLMYNCGNYAMLADGKYLGDGVTVLGDYDMLAFEQFPGVVKTTAGKGCFIMGELYEVSTEDLMTCDFLESNGSMYNRELVKIRNDTNGTTHTAWMYILQKNFPMDLTKANSVVEYDRTQSWWGDSNSWK